MTKRTWNGMNIAMDPLQTMVDAAARMGLTPNEADERMRAIILDDVQSTLPHCVTNQNKSVTILKSGTYNISHGGNMLLGQYLRVGEVIPPEIDTYAADTCNQRMCYSAVEVIFVE